MFCCYVAGMTPFCVSNFWVKIKINIMKAKISFGFYACVQWKTRKREINIEREIPAGVIILTD